MIKANELRIGNLFQGEKFSIARYGMQSDGYTSITGYGIYLLSENDNILDLKPIPLTEEWLLKFGFKLNMDNFSWNAGIGINEIFDFKLSLRYSDRVGWFYLSKCTLIKYVNHLQNLYFALTGEELEFSI